MLLKAAKPIKTFVFATALNLSKHSTSTTLARRVFGLSVFIAVLAAVVSHAQAQTSPQFRVLLFTKTNGWHHASQAEAVPAMRGLARKHSFALDWHQNAYPLSDELLAKYDAIVFMLTTGKVLTADEEKSLRRFIGQGKGFVGIHSAADTEKESEWFRKLIGHTFVIHPPVQTARLSVHSRRLSGLERFPDSLLWTDEWYEFSAAHSDQLNYILTVDESSFDPRADWGHVQGNGMGDFHPIAWYQQIDGGRAFYTALGHMPEVYENQLFLDHVFGGLYWAATGKGLLKQ